VIVASILLAFSIDAWWERIGDARDEAQSLALVSRDLLSAIEQLQEYTRFAESVSDTALAVFVSLSRPAELDQTRVSSQLQWLGQRRTISLPSAAYTDLVSTGNLRVIRDRGLRDAIVRFYESAERTALILEKNSGLLIDQFMFGLWGEGLLLYRAEGPRFTEASAAGRDQVASRLGPDFHYGPDYLWSLSPDSAEWQRVRSRLTIVANILATSQGFAGELIDEATALRSMIQESAGR